MYADERLLEEHLLAHALGTANGTAILGHLDWPADMPRNAVMNYVCGDAALQFAYTLIPRLPALDHRFFYTSNISLKRDFLVSAADAGIRFDPAFRHAAFEDSEFAFRLMPRGLEIHYVESARAVHDHSMDLESFAARERRAGEMAVVFYRKHPGQDEQLQVQWLAELSALANARAIRTGYNWRNSNCSIARPIASYGDSRGHLSARSARTATIRSPRRRSVGGASR